jgi:hypothetical protein
MKSFKEYAELKDEIGDELNENIISQKQEKCYD